MNDHEEAPDPQHPLDPETFARFAVRDPREIRQLLNAIVEKRQLLSAFVDGGPSFVTVALSLDPDEGMFTLDAPSDATLLEQAGSAAQIVCLTRLDNVTIQFGLDVPARVIFDSRPALRAAVPDSVLRLQRREYFRVPAPVSDPLFCMVPHLLPDGRKKSVAVKILDISGGGLAVLVPPDEIAFEPGAEFSQCSITLPDGDPIHVNLKVRNLFEVEKPNGAKVMRAGCEFGGLSAQGTARIQRYLFRLQRDARTRQA